MAIIKLFFLLTLITAIPLGLVTSFKCHKCMGFKFKEDNFGLTDEIKNVLNDIPKDEVSFPFPVTDQCLTSPDVQTLVECSSLCLTVIATINTVNYGGPDLGESGIESSISKKIFNFTKEFINQLEHGQLAMRTCLDEVLDAVNISMSDLGIESEDLPQDPACVDAEGSAFGVNGKARLCSCTGDFCNDEPTLTLTPAEPLEKNDTQHIGNFSAYHCAQAKFSSSDIQDIFSYALEGIKSNESGFHIDIPTFTDQCISKPTHVVKDCKTMALNGSASFDFHGYNGPFPDVLKNISDFLPFKFDSFNDLGSGNITVRTCLNKLNSDLPHESFEAFPVTKVCGKVNVSVFGANGSVSACGCNSDYCNGPPMTDTQTTPNPVVHGQWGPWNVIPEDCCTNGGQRGVIRYCDSPAPAYGGWNCLHSDGNSRLIKVEKWTPCSCVNGSWGQWKLIDGDCCEFGSRSIDRFCDSPSPAGGGLKCLHTDGISRSGKEENSETCSCAHGILLSGGVTSQSSRLSSFEVYNPTNPTKNTLLDVQMLTALEGSVSEVVNDETVLIAGGNDGTKITSATQLFNIRSNTIISGPPMSESRSYPGITVLNGTVYICGGQNHLRRSLDSCEKFIAGKNPHWESVKPMSFKADELAMVQHDDYLFIMGGLDPWRKPLSKLSRFSPSAWHDIWQRMSPMTSSVSGLGAAVLNGYIYACGGKLSGDWYSSSCRRYDPESNEWTLLPSMKSKRYKFNLVAFNGKLFALGGRNRSHKAISTVESYDPHTNKWTMEQSLNVERASGAAVVVGQPVNGSWSPWKMIEDDCCGLGNRNKVRLCDSPSPAFGGLECLHSDGNTRLVKEDKTEPCACVPGILLNGGGLTSESPNKKLSSLEVYYPGNPAKNHLLDVQMLTVLEGSVSEIIDHTLLIAGGVVAVKGTAATQLFDTKFNTIKSGQPMLEPRGYPGSATLNGTVYICGGQNRQLNSIDTCEKFTSGKNPHWESIKPMNFKTHAFGMVQEGNALYVMGGYGEQSPVSLLSQYDPTTDTWYSRRYMNTARYGLGAAALNGYIYACGGRYSMNQYFSSCERYDPKTDQWTGVASMNADRYMFNLVSFDGKLFALGGKNKSRNAVSTVESYDPDTDKWTLEQPLQVQRSYSGAVVLGQREPTTQPATTTTSLPTTDKTSQSAATTSQPVTTKSQPVTTKSQPVTTNGQPATTKSQPATSKSQPATTMSQLVTTEAITSTAKTIPAPVDGGWGQWNLNPAKSDCCANNGKKGLIRYCNQPIPANGGSYCLSSDGHRLSIDEKWENCVCAKKGAKPVIQETGKKNADTTKLAHFLAFIALVWLFY